MPHAPTYPHDPIEQVCLDPFLARGGAHAAVAKAVDRAFPGSG